MQRLIQFFALILLLVGLSGCQSLTSMVNPYSHGGSSDDSISTGDSKKFVYAIVGGVNHTGDAIQSFGIDKQWGGNISAYGARDGVCCIGVPRTYHPGLTVTVDWEIYVDEKYIQKTTCQG